MILDQQVSLKSGFVFYFSEMKEWVQGQESKEEWNNIGIYPVYGSLELTISSPGIVEIWLAFESTGYELNRDSAPPDFIPLDRTLSLATSVLLVPSFALFGKEVYQYIFDINSFVLEGRLVLFLRNTGRRALDTQGVFPHIDEQV